VKYVWLWKKVKVHALFVDGWMMNRKLEVCTCDGYSFPHRRSSKWCAGYTGILTDQDYEERYGRYGYG
jgi:hypothetical protein